MTKNKLSFESENIAVDWVGFNIQGFVNRKQIEKIANYLFQNFNFNSTFAKGPDGKKKVLFNDSKNKYQVYFRSYNYSDTYWDGIKIDFFYPTIFLPTKKILNCKLSSNSFKAIVFKY
jgi:hypothetical protein